MSGITVLTKEFDRLAQRNTEILNTDAGEGKSLGESAEILAEFEANTGRMQELRGGMEKASEFEALNKWGEQPATRSAVPFDDPTVADTGAPAGPSTKGMTPGRQFTENAAFKSYMDSIAPDGKISDNTDVKSAKFTVKDLVTGAPGSGGAAFESDRTGIYVPFVQPALTVRDLVLNLRTEADLVEYFRAVEHVNVAAAVLEATTAADIGSGADSTTTPPDPGVTAIEAGLKPDAAFTWERITEAVQPIAEGAPISKRTLMNGNMIEDIIDNQLRYDLAQALNSQMISGDGTDANLTGIRNTPGIQTQPFSNNIIETLRKAKTKVTNPLTGSGQVPNGAVLTPAVMETLDLFRVGGATAADGAFLINPYSPGSRSIWGMSLVEEPAMTANKAIVGFFRDAILWDRQQTTVEVFNQHKDYAMRNMVQLLAEWWGTFGVTRPRSFADATMA